MFKIFSAKIQKIIQSSIFFHNFADINLMNLLYRGPRKQNLGNNMISTNDFANCSQSE